MLELRVLTGTHAGARVLLPATPQKLGSGPDCDLVLTDEGILEMHAEVTAQEDGTVLIQLKGPDTSEIRLAQGEAVDLGPVRISIETADSPWREDAPVRSLAPAASEPKSQTPAEPETQDAQEAQPAPQAGDPRKHRVLMATLALAVLALLIGIAFVASGSTGRDGWARLQALATGAAPTGDATATQAAPTADSQQQQQPLPVDQVRALIDPLGLGGRVRVEAEPRRGVRVKAAFLSDTEAATLRAALATLPWHPRLDMLSPSQMQVILEDHLITLAPLTPGHQLTATALANGRYRIDGRVANAAEREQLQSQLTKAMPLVQGFDFQITTDEEVAGALLQALRELGVGQVQASWTGSRLEGQVTLPQNLVARWERGLAAAVAQYPVPVNVALAVTQAVAPPPPTLPFAVRSVIGSGGGFVTLDDGQRLAVDGQAKGWRLAAIRSDAVVFERADGARVTLER